MDNNSITVSSEFLSDLALSFNQLERALQKDTKTIDVDKIDFKSASKYLGLTESHLRKLVFEKQIPVNRIGRKLVFSKKQIDHWIMNL